MSEFLAAIVGGIFALIGTFWGIKYQITKEKEEKREDYKNDILSMIDLTAYKASKISKIHLSETNALINKPQTLEKCDDVEELFVKLDDQIQELLGTMSHHEEESNKPIRDLLNCYESLENYISKFSIAARIYNDKYETNSDDKRVIIVRTKEKLGRNINTFINDLRQFSKHHFNHDMYEPTLKFESE
ncbi:hypothetical protein MKS55_03965 [Staphylococcus haemolyticus]|uniref:hypothetical protein n=1 Tax=Staphylococcus haemolyticus TaxID=1283 RepID=UPI001F0AD779|nr:hypothetical protein [Staphylococcus haemolyticus]MCH4475954.1 hypothetical protein [Staphylococcus haemolyticus]